MMTLTDQPTQKSAPDVAATAPGASSACVEASMHDTTHDKPPQGSVQHYVDASPIPAWGTAGDGARVRLTADEGLEQDYAAWLAGACQHVSQFTGKTVSTIGADMYRRYCKNCGIATTQFLPHRTIAATVVTVVDPDKREAVVDRYISDRRDALEDIANRAANRVQPANRAEYSDYRATPKWKGLRAAVMRRCSGRCEGCDNADAQDVHHLTYRHMGDEFLFELVGLCRACHDRWHKVAA